MAATDQTLVLSPEAPGLQPRLKLQERFPDIIYRKLTPAPEHPHFNYKGFNPSTQVIQKGHVRSPGRRAFPVEVIFERDITITMRDGIKLYADVFRPTNSESAKVPAILPWSPYGKTGTGPQDYDFMAPFRAGIAKDATSGYEKFEAPDPAEWCQRGYAIVNVDARGAGHSEGNIAHWGDQEAEDIYDVIDWCSLQSWCSGSVGMAGNSWLAISQVNFAARLSHPALKALAPWESYTDIYRDFVARGGRPHIPKFHKMIMGGFAGPNSVEDIVAMLATHPLYDDYWEAKRIPVENIADIPLYILASYSSMFHTRGSLETFKVAQTKSKWQRIHPYQEWYDLYRPEVTNDLHKYFDRFLKGIKNGWEDSTPPVRLSLLGFDNSSPAKTVLERPENEYPLARQQMQTFYLDVSNRTLSRKPVAMKCSDSYKAHDLDVSIDFVLKFDEATELAGYSKVKIFMSCAEHDDMDVVVQIRKIDSKGRLLQHLNYPCPVPVEEVPDLNTVKTLGPQGFLRASHAVSLDPDSTSDVQPFYTHRIRNPIKPGTIVPLEIGIWPIGMVFAAGEGIMFRVSGHDMCLPETEMCRLIEPEDGNVGYHTIYTGGEYNSYLIIPIIPPK